MTTTTYRPNAAFTKATIALLLLATLSSPTVVTSFSTSTTTSSAIKLRVPLAVPLTTTTQSTQPPYVVRSTTSCLVSTKTKEGRNMMALEMSSAAATVDASSGDDDDSGVSSSTEGEGATIPSHIFNLVKNIVGAGVLSLPAGIAAFGNAPSALLPSTLLIASIGTISAYGFSLIGRVCSYTGATSYRDAWDKTVGTSTSWIPAASCTFKTGAAILAYSMILADTFTSLLQSAGFVNAARSSTLFGVTGLVLLPLCLLKNLSSLAPFSLLGVIGMLFTSAAMAVRYFGKTYKLPKGKFLVDVPKHLQPSFGTTGARGMFSPNVFILICMLSTAYMAHFNAPKFYNELKDNTIERYNKVVKASFGISIGTFAAIASLGFLTFGSSCSGLILNNYSNKDALMSLSRIAVAVSIVFSYPLAFTGARDGVLDLLNTPTEKRTNFRLNAVTVAILSAVTFGALKVNDLSFVLAFSGATLGNALIYVYPALMFRSAIKAMGDGASGKLKKEVNAALASAGVGIGMGVVGSIMAIKSIL